MYWQRSERTGCPAPGRIRAHVVGEASQHPGVLAESVQRLRVDDRPADVLGRLDGRLAVGREAVVAGVVHPDPQRQPAGREVVGRAPGRSTSTCSSVVSSGIRTPSPARTSLVHASAQTTTALGDEPVVGSVTTSTPAAPRSSSDSTRASLAEVGAGGHGEALHQRRPAAGRHDRAALLEEPDRPRGQRELRPAGHDLGVVEQREVDAHGVERRRCSRPSGSRGRAGTGRGRRRRRPGSRRTTPRGAPSRRTPPR